ncbi:MAG TPA: hypothetical protein VN281_13290, partial [Verrucomicrobiae bacterium]|nr:hypothetical protein [Verrucomicrobiae bacterium]
VYSVFIVGLLVRRRWPRVRRHLFQLGIAIGIYFVIVVLVGISSPARVLAAEEILRYDDWCLAVEKTAFADAVGAVTRAEPENRFVIVTLRVISAAGRVPQAAPKGSLVYLLDEKDGRYDVSRRGQLAYEAANGSQPELTTKLDPSSSFLTIRVFEVPRDTKVLSLAHRHGSGFPGMLIIGSGFRKPTVIRLHKNEGLWGHI